METSYRYTITHRLSLRIEDSTPRGPWTKRDDPWVSQPSQIWQIKFKLTSKTSD